MTPFYRCTGTDTRPHDEVRWAWVDGRHCWLPTCGTIGKPAVAYVITAIDAFIRDLDDDHAPPPVASAATTS